jgi:CheY-like chemotaxis protein
MPEDNRHNWANWWGIRQLCQIHSGLDMHLKVGYDSVRFNGKEFINLNRKLKKLEAQKAIYLYGFKEKEIQKIFFEHELQELINLKQNKENEIREYKEEVRKNIGKQLTKVRNSPDDSKLEAENKELEELINETDNEIKENILAQINSVKKQIPKFELGELLTLEQPELQQLNALRRLSISKAARILFIDDQAEDGWSDIFKLIIYNQKNVHIDYFKTLSNKIWEDYKPIFNNTSDINELKKKITIFYTEQIRPFIVDKDGNFLRDMLILDLRLGQETEQDIEKLSGVLLLNKIKKEFPALPIMVVTASNKSWSHQEVMRNGADAYWTKEGIDITTSLIDKEKCNWSFENYKLFLDLIVKLSGEEYQFLNWFGREVKSLIDNKINGNFYHHWWENCNWKNGDNTKVIISDEYDCTIYNILNDSIIIINEYLRTYSKSYQRFVGENYFSSAIIQQLAKIVEIVHNIGGEDIISRIYYWEQRDDYCAGKLLHIRNRASHQTQYGWFDFNDVKLFSSLLILWLKDNNYHQNVNKETAGITKRLKINEKSYFGNYRLTLDYINILWWLEKYNPLCLKIISPGHKNRIINILREQITKHKVKKIKSDWKEFIKTQCLNLYDFPLDIDSILAV